MLGRPAATILFIASQRIARADFSAGGKLLGLWQEPRPDFDDLISQVETALALGDRCGRKVWLLCADLWTQAIAMSARTTAKLSDADLSRALAFELETLSGTSALDSVVGHVALPADRQDERHFWVVQAAIHDRDAIDDHIRRSGGRFMGMTHPGGVPRQLVGEPGALAPGGTLKGGGITKNAPGANAPGSPINWQRIELWPDVIVCLHGEPGQPPRPHVINADPKQERWHAEEEAWRNRVGKAQQREMLLATGELVVFDEAGQPMVRQESEETLKSLLTAWAAVLGKSAAVPLVKPAVRPLSSAQRGLIAVGISLAAAVILALHHFFINQAELNRARDEVARLRQPVQQINSLNQQAAALGKELEVIKKDLEALKRTNDALMTQRHRLPRLLAALAEHPADDLLVQKIDGSIDQPAIHGLCLGQNQANQFATRLARALPDWQVLETKVRVNEKTGGPYEFTILLKMPAPPDAEKKGANVPESS